MAVLIQHDRVVSAWLAAARHLTTCPEYTDRNLVLEVSSPGVLEAQDRDVIGAVEAFHFLLHPQMPCRLAALFACVIPQRTLSGTIVDEVQRCF